MKMELWEILVPTVRNDGRPFKTCYHKVWDKKVYDITGGITIMKPTRGKWVSEGPDAKYYEERMIPVRIATSRENIEKIIDVTKEYYDQIKIMCYKISEEVIIR
jgi:hypothetical protein